MKNILIIDDEFSQFQLVRRALFEKKNEENSNQEEKDEAENEKYFFSPTEYQCFPRKDEAESFCNRVADFSENNKLNELYFYIVKYIEEHEIEAIFTDRSFKEEELSAAGNATGEIIINKLKNNTLHKELMYVIYSRRANAPTGVLEELLEDGENNVLIPTVHDVGLYRNAFLSYLGNGKDTSSFLMRIKSLKSRNYQYNIAFVCALEKEYDGVKIFLDDGVVNTAKCGDSSCFYGYMTNKDTGIILKVLMIYMKENDTFFGEYGPLETIEVSGNIKNNCKPEYMVMTGVMAGYKGITELGDVIVSKTSYKCKSPRNSKSNPEFFRDPESYSGCFQNHIQTLKMENKKNLDNNELSILGKIVEEYIQENGEIEKYELETDGIEEEKTLEDIVGFDIEGDKSRFKIHEAATITRDGVLDDQDIFNSIYEKNDSIIGLEMEIYALYKNIGSCDDIKTIALKTVVDYADGKKHKAWHKLGSYMSAKIMHKLFLEIIYPSKIRDEND